METFVSLEAVAAIPVTATLDEGFGLFDVLLDEGLVAVEESSAYNGEG